MRGWIGLAHPPPPCARTLHCDRYGLWQLPEGRVTSSRASTDPAKLEYRRAVEFMPFLPWLLELATLDL
jgi:hypothetical protein